MGKHNQGTPPPFYASVVAWDKCSSCLLSWIETLRGSHPGPVEGARLRKVNGESWRSWADQEGGMQLSRCIQFPGTVTGKKIAFWTGIFRISQKNFEWRDFSAVFSISQRSSHPLLLKSSDFWPISEKIFFGIIHHRYWRTPHGIFDITKGRQQFAACPEHGYYEVHRVSKKGDCIINTQITLMVSTSYSIAAFTSDLW